MRDCQKWSNEDTEKLRKLCQECNSFQELREKASGILPERKWSKIQSKLNENLFWTQHFEDKRSRVRVLKAGDKPIKKIKELTLEDKSFPKPEVLEIDKAAWERPGQRVGFYSAAGFKDEGFRAGLLRFRELSRQEGVHFDVWNGGLVSKKWIKEEIRKRLTGAHHDLHEGIIDNFLNEATKELNSLIPKLKKPNGNNGNGGYIRLYLITSPTRDGHFGEEIARRLQKLRPEDVRCYKVGGDRIEVKRPDNKNKIIWTINPQRPRLPSQYYSQAAEKEINDKRGQTTKNYPDLWVVGNFASNIHKPNGERDEPYITIGALRRLEEVLVAENQISISIVEYTPEGNRFVRVWNLKDIVAHELDCITGIKSGAEEIHRRIIEALKKHRPATIGILADELGADRQVLEEKIKFLVEEKQSLRKTWPGLYKDPSSQRYDFHLDWIQEKLIYHPINIYDKSLNEDRLLFFGCPHVGFTTSDYKFITEKIPQQILDNKIKTIALLGDITAGLHHEYLESGEVFGSLNNTDQEKFAAELFGTVLIKVFRQRFEENLANCNNIKEAIDNSLPAMPYIPGNHDLWQEKEGTIPLEVFHDKLTGLLARYIGRILVEKGLPAVDIFDIIARKIIRFPDYKAVYRLPSGLDLEMHHPHMARAKTTSLRAQETLDVSRCQIVGIANFHTATVVCKWYPDRGQCVAVQAGTLIIYSRFEKRKTKRIDFGPVFLRVLSKNQRIIMTESAYFNESLLKEPISKWTNLDQLKKELGILSAL